MAITTENYLKDLIKQKNDLVSTLQDCGVEASKEEKFNTLVPKVADAYEAGKASGGNTEETFAAGQQAEYDRFWDNYQQNGERRNYTYGFSGICWNDETYNPKYPINADSATGIFSQTSEITSTKVPISINTVGTHLFYSCTNLKVVPSIKVVESMEYDYCFTNCKSLENITFTDDSVIANDISFKDCTKLTHESLMSIINALKDLTYKTYTYNGGMVYDNVTNCPDFYSTITVTYNDSDDYNLRLSGVDENNKEQFVDIYYPNSTAEYFYDLAECPLSDLEIKTFSCRPAEGAEDIALEFEFTYIKPYNEPTTTKTLTLGSTNLAKLTDEEKAIATNKGWVLA